MKTRKLVRWLLIGVIGMGFAGCGTEGTTEAKSESEKGAKTEEKVEKEVSEQGKVLNVYCWNDEFPNLFKTYYEDKGLVPDDIVVNFIITPNADNQYQNALDEALLNQENTATDERVDLFLVEADYALKYVDSDFALSVMDDIGLTEADLADQYQYTKDIVTDSEGVQKGTSWQATPGLFAYRRSIAKEVLGTDDPKEVQAALSDWESFNKVAADAAAKGYKMLSGFDDAYRTYSNNVSKPWVKGNKIVVDDNLMTWVDQTKEFTDKGYNNKTSLWSGEWSSDQGPDGDVFGFFYSTWGINFTLLGNALATPVAEGGKLEVGNGIFGDYAVCEGPQNYYWGGTWLVGAEGTDNIDLIRDIMKVMTCDEATMKQITEDTQDFTNNKKAMDTLANSDYQSAFLGGQNHIALFAESAGKIDMSNITGYDQGLTTAFQASFKDYFEGLISKEEALDNFYMKAIETYPDLQK